MEYDKERTKIRADTLKKMKLLGTYKKSFDRIIDIYADLILQYSIANEKFIDSGYEMTEEYTNKAGATNIRKTAIYLSLETIRKDILTFSSQLGLNPKGFDSLSMQPTEETSKLDKLQQDLASWI